MIDAAAIAAAAEAPEGKAMPEKLDRFPVLTAGIQALGRVTFWSTFYAYSTLNCLLETPVFFSRFSRPDVA